MIKKLLAILIILSTCKIEAQNCINVNMNSIDRIGVDNILDVKPLDINNDGLIDFVSCSGADSLCFYHNNGNNNYTIEPFIVNGNFYNVRAIETGDFNLDGEDDIMLVIKDNNSLIMSNNNGQFSIYQAFTIGFSGNGSIVADAEAIDIDNDNDLDIVILSGHYSSTNNVQSNILVLKNNSGVMAIDTSYLFSQTNLQSVSDIEIQLVDNDTIEDVVLVSYQGVEAYQTFSNQLIYSNINQAGGFKADFGDFNQTGVNSLVVASIFGNDYSLDISGLTNYMTLAQNSPLDIIVMDDPFLPSQYQISLLANKVQSYTIDAVGVVSSNNTYLIPNNFECFEKGDFNKDGIQDLIICGDSCILYLSDVDSLNPTISFSYSNTTPCDGDSLKLTIDQLSYQNIYWNTGSAGSSIYINQTGYYYVQADSSNCTGISDTIYFLFNSLPSFSLGEDTVICNPDSLLISGPAGSYSYVWNTADTIKDIMVGSSGSYSLAVTDSNGCVYNDTIYVSVDVCTGIKRLSKNDSRVYPNPFIDNLIIETFIDKKIDFIEIQSFVSKKLFSIQNVNSNKLQLDLGFLPKGNYLLKIVYDDKSIITHKLIKY